MLAQDIEDIDATVVWWKWQECCFLVLFIFFNCNFFPLELALFTTVIDWERHWVPMSFVL